MTSIYHELLKANPSFRRVLNCLKDRETPIGVYGLPEQVIAPFAETVKEECKRPVLLVTWDLARATKLVEDLSYFAEGGVYHLAARELFFFQRDAGSHELLARRLQTLQAMLNGEGKIVVTTPEALGGIFLKPHYLKNASFTLKVGESMEIDDLMARLATAGYQRVD